MIKILSTLTLSLTLLLAITACQKNDNNNPPDKKVSPHALDKNS